MDGNMMMLELEEVDKKKIVAKQLQGRLETLEQTENELREREDKLSAQYVNSCEEIDLMSQQICVSASDFINHGSVYSEAAQICKINNGQEKASIQDKLQQLEKELAEILEKDKIYQQKQADEQQQDEEIKALLMTKRELEQELESRTKSVDALENEKGILFFLPDKDRTFIRLREKLSETKRKEEENQQLRSTLEKELQRPA